jgi:hypothetical protein
MELKRLIKVLTPFAKTIASLESSQSNPADVYLFWLAILASLKRLFDDDTAGFSVSEAGEIRAIANARFRELLQEGPDDCYISAFYLNPSMSIWVLFQLGFNNS